ncbi:MAG TPA: bis-aminopropyl spermidine synthase family protein [Candidatus Dormibacteraeota bacterium]|nr:bis-aminopropyl spermidine synthase family protein [Candidatus Dormibacteraeota bacterium]
MPESEIDLRAAINAVSDVVQNRPRPLRIYDQIYMKAGDMVLQSQVVARWAKDKRLAFIGDGDAISICVAYLQRRGIVPYGPSKIMVFDFDERICNAVTRFADKERIENLSAQLYNCLDSFIGATNFDCFYTNPPWGASNGGESAKVFVQRGMEAAGFSGEGMVVVADDLELEWPKRVLASIQAFAIDSGYFVQEMVPQLHTYHLDDAPDLRSCNLVLKALPGGAQRGASKDIREPARLANFYGQGNDPRVRYVRERHRLEYGTAHDDEYFLEFMETSGGPDR